VARLEQKHSISLHRRFCSEGLGSLDVLESASGVRSGPAAEFVRQNECGGIIFRGNSPTEEKLKVVFILRRRHWVATRAQYDKTGYVCENMIHLDDARVNDAVTREIPQAERLR
jgi:hypothetical protein